jgi:multidrug efflux pump subunit AcrA (membrane-fusion protein)
MKINKLHLHFWMLLMLVPLVSCKQEETVVPEMRTIEDAVFASGYTEQEISYTVSSNVEGILLSLPIKEDDIVSKEDVIAVIKSDVQQNQLQDAMAVYKEALQDASPDSPELLNIQAQIDQAQVQLAFDQEIYLRYKDLWDKKSVSMLDFEKAELQFKASQSNLIALQKQYRETENALNLQLERSLVQVNSQQSVLKDYQITTGTPGKVIEVYKKQGELVRRGEAIAKIGSGPYLLKLLISEEDITRVAIGNPVAVALNTYPNETFQARVSKIYPGFNESEQSYIAEAKFEHTPERLFSGTQLQANIQTGSREKVLVVPSSYVWKGNFVKLSNGEEKQLVTGARNSEWTEVVSGLSREDILVKPRD